MRNIYWLLKKRSFEQFLTPNRVKLIALTVVLFSTISFSLLLPRVYSCPIPRCPNEEWVTFPWKVCPSCSIGASDYVFGLIYYAIFPFSFSEMYGASLDIFMSFFLLSAQLLYWYLIICCIAWLYGKKRKHV
jgi:hypothetical protein